MIRLVRATVLEAPGLPDGMELRDLGPGLVLIVGPNASGKSTLVRTVLGALWPGDKLEAVRAEFLLETGVDTTTASLRYGTVTWHSGRPPLPSPETRELLALNLRSLLEGAGPDEGFSRRIAVELMAGYDLETATASFESPTARKGELQKRLASARTALRGLERRAADLARRQEKLETLRRRRNEALGAREMAHLAKEAGKLVPLRARIKDLEAQIATLPKGLDSLRKNDDAELDSLDDAAAKAREEVKELRRRREQDRGELEELHFPTRHPKVQEMEAWRERARELESITHHLATLHDKHAGAVAKRQEAREGLGSWEPPTGSLPNEALQQLEGALDERTRARAQVQELEAATSYWASQATEKPAAGARRLALGIDALRSWLRAVPVGRTPTWPGWLSALAGAAVAIVSLLPVAMVLPTQVISRLLPAGSLLLGTGGGYLVALWLVQRRHGGDMEEAIRRAGEAGMASGSWEEESVRQRLRLAEEQRDALLLKEQAAQRAAEAREAQKRAREALEKIETNLASLTVSLGLVPDLPNLRLIEAARRVGDWLEARRTVAEIEGRIDSLAAMLEKGLGKFGAWLESLGLAAPEDASAASAAVNDLLRRLERIEQLARGTTETERDLTRAEERLADAKQAIEAFWERTGITSRDPLELRRRLGYLAQYLELRKELTDRRSLAAELEKRLKSEGAWELLRLDPEDFTEQQVRKVAERHEREADRYEGIIEEITEIEQKIGQAEAGSQLEEARARLEETARDLAEHRDLAMENMLARFLVERARDAHRREHAPPVLRRARELFASFTRDAFHLDVDPDGTFYAIDTALAARRSLEELSDGTRIHLLLAARLAALEEAEGIAGPLPLFLDEALSTTDPGRFRKIARALLTLIGAGRQVLYLTADPSEVGQWREACREAGMEAPDPIRLAPPRSSVSAWEGAPAPDVGAVPNVPSPGDLDAIAWAKDLRVPAPAAQRPAGAWHPLHLLPDRLETVHTLLKLGYTTVGQLLAALEAGGLRKVVEPGDRALLSARTALFSVALGLWSEGRGRPVTWEDVRASGAVSSTFEERVRELVESHGSDPEAFVEAVHALSRFRSDKASDLKEHFCAEGIFPNGALLGPDEIAAVAVDRCHAKLQAAEIDAPEATAYVRTVLSLLEG